MNFVDFSHSELQELLTRQQIVPPCILLNVDAFRQFVRKHLAESDELGVDWWPLIVPPLGAAERATLVELGVSATCEPFVPPAECVAHRRPVVLLHPPVSVPALHRLGKISRSGDLGGVVCDHFAQAEALSLAERFGSRDMPVFLRIGFGTDRWGVFPGRELEQLAAGIRELTGVALRGLFLPDRENDRTKEVIAAEEEFVRLAIKGVDSVPWESEPPYLIVDTFRTARLLQVALPDVRISVRQAILGMYEGVVAEIVARPLMELAVANVGLAEVGQDPRLMRLRHWEIRRVGEYATSLLRRNPGESLVIGDLVCMKLAPHFRPPHYLPTLRRTNGVWQRGDT